MSETRVATPPSVAFEPPSPRDGPTSKADCLNNVLDAILQFEARANVTFAGSITTNAGRPVLIEDVSSGTVAFQRPIA